MTVSSAGTHSLGQGAVVSSLRNATGDTTYGTVESIHALEDAGNRAYVPLTDWDNHISLFGREAFSGEL
jgi:hypothetical protein